MTIDRPGGPGPAPTEAPHGPDATDATDAADAAHNDAFAPQLQGAAPGRPGAPAGPPDPTGGDPVARIAADLRAGAITPAQAIERIVQAAAASGVPAEAAAEIRDRIRGQLAELVTTDPALAARARRLGADNDDPA